MSCQKCCDNVFTDAYTAIARQPEIKDSIMFIIKAVDAVKHAVKSESDICCLKLKFITAVVTETRTSVDAIARQPEIVATLNDLFAFHCVSLYYDYFIMFNYQNKYNICASHDNEKMKNFGKKVDSYLCTTLFSDAVKKYLCTYKLE